MAELPAVMQSICEKLIDFCKLTPYYKAIILKQIPVPEDTDYEKHKNQDS